MKGRASGLDRLSEGLQARKILLSLFEEVGRSLLSFEYRQNLILLQMNDPHLLPPTLPDVFRLPSRTFTHTWTFTDPTAYVFGVTPTPQPQPMSTGAAPLTLNLPLSISRPNYNAAIASSSVFMTPSIPSTSFCPTLWTTSLAFHPTPLAPKQVTRRIGEIWNL